MTLFYVLVISCGTPLIYLVGIEENRRKTQEYFKSNMRIFTKVADDQDDVKAKSKAGDKKDFAENVKVNQVVPNLPGQILE